MVKLRLEELDVEDQKTFEPKDNTWPFTPPARYTMIHKPDQHRFRLHKWEEELRKNTVNGLWKTIYDELTNETNMILREMPDGFGVRSDPAMEPGLMRDYCRQFNINDGDLSFNATINHFIYYVKNGRFEGDNERSESVMREVKHIYSYQEFKDYIMGCTTIQDLPPVTCSPKYRKLENGVGVKGDGSQEQVPLFKEYFGYYAKEYLGNKTIRDWSFTERRVYFINQSGLLTYELNDPAGASSCTKILTLKEFKDYILNTNTNNNGKQNKTSGHTIEVPRPHPSIVRGNQRTGKTVSGRRCKTTITVGHLSHQTISI